MNVIMERVVSMQIVPIHKAHSCAHVHKDIKVMLRFTALVSTHLFHAFPNCNDTFMYNFLKRLHHSLLCLSLPEMVQLIQITSKWKIHAVSETLHFLVSKHLKEFY